jgi:tetratricopeptide (TPR) repeat protein
LRRKGYDAYVQESLDKRNGKQVWQSVRIGRFQDRKTAQNALELFKRKESGMAVFIASNDSYAEGGNKNKGATPAESTLVSRAAVQGGKESAVGPGKEAVPPVVVDKKEEIAPQAGKAVQEGAAEAKEVKSAPPQEEAAAAPGRRDREGGVRGDREAAEQLFQQSLAFRNNRDLEQEELALRQSLQKDGGHALARNRLARILVESKRVEEGLRLLQGAVQGRSAAVLVGEDSNLAAFLAALYQRQEEHVQAVELYEALLVRHPDKGIWRMGLAISLEKMGRTPPALAAYRQALSDSAMTPNLRRFVESRIEQLQ